MKTTPDPLSLCWSPSARPLASPHFNHRPADEVVDMLVIHNISLPPGQFGGDYISQLFLGTLDCQADPFFAQLEGLRVSAHCLIRRDGELIQYVPFEQRAWHAGVSCFMGREGCNDFSIGIELEGTDTAPYTDAQYESLVTLSLEIIALYPAITPERIVGHSDIAPGRKTDPGESFDWLKYRQMLDHADR